MNLDRIIGGKFSLLFPFLLAFSAFAHTEFENNLKPAHKELIEKDIQNLNQFDYVVRDFKDHPFEAGLSFYLNERVSYVIAPEKNYGKDLKFSNKVESQTYGVNLGAAILGYMKSQGVKDVSLSFNNTILNKEEIKKGVIQLFDPYYSEQSLIMRLAVLVHEARHTDEGHEHIVCNKPNIYYGEESCDENLNGSIGMELDFVNSILTNGKDISEVEVQSAIMIKADREGRINEK